MKIYSYFKNNAEENISLKFRSKNVDETRNYFIKETKQKELMSNKQKKVLTTLNYIKHFLILASAVTESIFISFLASLLVIPTEITSSAIELKISATTAGIKNCKSIIKQKKKKYEKIVLLTKPKLNSIES